MTCLKVNLSSNILFKNNNQLNNLQLFPLINHSKILSFFKGNETVVMLCQVRLRSNKTVLRSTLGNVYDCL